MTNQTEMVKRAKTAFENYCLKEKITDGVKCEIIHPYISGYYAATVTNTASDTNIKSELLAALNLGLASVQESRGSQSEIEQALNIKQIRAAIERLNKLEGK